MLDKEGVDYIAYTEDAIAVRKSMNYDLDGFANMCDDSRELIDRSTSYDYNSTLKDNSRFTFKENGMITLGNSLEGETPKIKNSTFGDSFGDM